MFLQFLFCSGILEIDDFKVAGLHMCMTSFLPFGFDTKRGISALAIGQVLDYY